MRILIQRVLKASVEVAGCVHASIGQGLLLFLGIEDNDTGEDIEWLCRKTASLRIFDDSNGVMNLNVTDIGGKIMVISQFTLHAMTKKGNRPSYIRAAKPDTAIPLYEEFISVMESMTGGKIASGIFGADMKVGLVNDGPVTIWMDSKNKE
ncbi:MAG: D-tyrosyl-tRNA(Tyr) deacylase [Rikenellaceae bacterium]|nr:D-tyrosyl-tRNA(Tyr) deacylase [Rikenellaceae bacterium]